MTRAIAASVAPLDTARRMHPRTAEMEPRTDEALMRAYGQGDARAFETLYARHKGATYRYFLRHAGGDTSTADELHQDLWLRVIGARERYEAQAKFSTWLYTLARHRLVDHWRSRHGISLASLEDDEILTQTEASTAASRDVARRSTARFDRRRDSPPAGRGARRRAAAAAGCIPAAHRGRTLARRDREPDGHFG